MRASIGECSAAIRSFRPPAQLTVVLFLLVALFTGLGSWQLRRAAEKETAERQYESAAGLSLAEALANGARFAKIEVRGHYDGGRHILLDNQVWQGRAGVFVFTPFYTAGGEVILVNRGWLPLPPDRIKMPEVPTPEGEIALRGMLNTPPVPGRTLGPVDRLERNAWPQLVTYLELAEVSRALGTPVEKWIVQLAESEAAGFSGRDWPAVYMSSSRHRGYAFQWFALAAAGLVIWVVVGLKSPNRRAR